MNISISRDNFIENEIENAIYSTGFAILQSSDEKVLLNKWIYFNFMFSEDLMKQMEIAMPKGQYPSINKSNIDNFQIPVPSISEQQIIVKEIEAYETKIAEAQKIMDNSAEQKRKILEKYLN